MRSVSNTGQETCLLEDAIKRAETVAMPQHICSVVAEQHRRWWGRALKNLPTQNIFVQPKNRGTAHGILLALLQIEGRTTNSIVVLLPADHYLTDEITMVRSVRTAANLAAENPGLVYLLGAEPDHPDQELGYIVSSERRRDSPSGVVRFFEKPTTEKARALIREGALWNTFIMAGSVRALLESHDFSRAVLQRHEQMLQVLRVPNCGWTDLGTPKRVEETIRNLAQMRLPTTHSATGAPYLDLVSSRRQTLLPRAS